MKLSNVLNMKEQLSSVRDIPYHHAIKTLPAEKPHFITDDKTIEKQIIFLLTTFKDMRAAHFFVYGEDETTWHLFSPTNSPLTQAEVGGHMKRGISEVVKGNSITTSKFSKPIQRYTRMGKQVRSFYTRLENKNHVFAILVFKDFIFIAGNVFGESSLCKAVMHYNPHKVSKPWAADSLNRLSFYNKKKQDILMVGYVHLPQKNVKRIVNKDKQQA